MRTELRPRRIRQGRKKQIILLFLSIVSAGIFFWSVRNTLYNDTGLFWTWVAPLIFGSVLVLFWGLISLLVKHRLEIFASLIISIILIFFIFEFKLLYLLSIFLIFVGFWLAYEKIRMEKKQRLKFQLHRLLVRGLPIMITCLIIFVSIAYYYAPSAQNFTPKIKVPNWIIKFSVQIVEKIMPEIMPQSQDDIDISQIISLLGVEANQDEIEKFFKSQLVHSFSGQETFEQTLEILFNKKIDDFFQTSEYVKYIPIALAISLFFSLNILNLFLTWIIILISFALIWILKKLGVIFLKEKRIKYETIKF